MTNAERIKEIEDRAAKATHGAWFLHDFTGPEINNIPSSRDVTVSCDHPATITVAEMGRGLTGALEEARANASFIAHSRTDIAFLLSTLRAVEADNARLRAALVVIRDMPLTELDNVISGSMRIAARRTLQDPRL